MTEVKRQSTAEDELDLIDLLKFLARKKVFILAIMFVCTLFSIFYAQSITPVYRATVGLLDHNESFSSSSVIEQLGLSDEVGHNTKSLNIFERFLFNVRSYELKQEVFVNGGFHKKFFRETGIDTDQSVSAIYNSTEIVKRNGVNYLELEGYKPKVMLEFLTALIEAAKENVNTEINDIKRSIVNTKINNVVVQIKALEQEIAVQKQMKKQKITLQKQIEKEKKELEIKELQQKITLHKQIEK